MATNSTVSTVSSAKNAPSASAAPFTPAAQTVSVAKTASAEDISIIKNLFMKSFPECPHVVINEPSGLIKIYTTFSEFNIENKIKTVKFCISSDDKKNIIVMIYLDDSNKVRDLWSKEIKYNDAILKLSTFCDKSNQEHYYIEYKLPLTSKINLQYVKKNIKTSIEFINTKYNSLLFPELESKSVPKSILVKANDMKQIQNCFVDGSSSYSQSASQNIIEPVVAKSVKDSASASASASSVAPASTSTKKELVFAKEMTLEDKISKASSEESKLLERQQQLDSERQKLDIESKKLEEEMNNLLAKIDLNNKNQALNKISIVENEKAIEANTSTKDELEILLLEEYVEKVKILSKRAESRKSQKDEVPVPVSEKASVPTPSLTSETTSDKDNILAPTPAESKKVKVGKKKINPPASATTSNTNTVMNSWASLD